MIKKTGDSKALHIYDESQNLPELVNILYIDDVMIRGANYRDCLIFSE